jgi:DNA mismatch repair protein MutS
MQAKEDGHELTLLHRVAEGPTDASFGIHVAKMAGVPEEVLVRARKVLNKLEEGSTIKVGQVQSVFSTEFSARSEAKENPILDEIRKMDLMNLTPLQALEKLHDVQQRLL